MKLKSLLIIISITASHCHAKELHPKFINAIHKVETDKKVGRIYGDHGKALGPLQIHRDYFQDAVEYDHSLGHDYNRVTDLNFAKRVVTAYLNRFAPKAVRTNNFMVLAMIHNGGPDGPSNPRTIKYWNQVKRYL